MKKLNLNLNENEIVKKFLKNGYIIVSILDKKNLNFISKSILKSLKQTGFFKNTIISNKTLNSLHKYVPSKDINKVRLKIINDLKKNKKIRLKFFELIKKYLELLVGNELAFQKNINLVIAPPLDNSAIQDIHADTWGGNSPFEIVAWLPLVDCFKTKSMFLLDLKKTKKHNLEKMIKDKKNNVNAEDLFNKIKKDVIWPKVKFGEILLFNPMLPHGAKVNTEVETRLSLNCRFKSIFSPYGDKKIGEYFEPLTIKPLSKIAFEYINEKI